MSDEFEEIVAGSAGAFRAALRRAYDAGLSAGRAQAESELLQKLGSTFGFAIDGGPTPRNQPVPALTEPLPITVVADTDAKRAVSGSVKPAITKAVMDHPFGLTTEEVRKLTGAKANTVRGTLWTLSTTEGLIERRDGKWFPVRKTNEAEEVTPKGNTSSAPISQPVNPLAPGSHQADPSEPGREVAHNNIEWN